MSLRLDQALVERGLLDSREKAKRAVMAGQVRINDRVAAKASETVKPTDELVLAVPEKFVSRGGYKLEHALDHFALNVTDLTAIDLGASTGGFTDCLLQRGAAKVFAVDVGHGQLAWKLRNDPRVVVMEKTNARELTPERLIGQSISPLPPAPSPREARAGRGLGRGATAPPLPSPLPHPMAERESGADLVVIDCSFISLRKILPAAVALLRSGGNIVALVKPQFEAGKAEADKGAGVITDPAIHQRVLQEIEEFVRQTTNLVWHGVTESPLLGPAGNKEFLVLIEKGS